jgi:hypothetical protein
MEMKVIMKINNKFVFITLLATVVNVQGMQDERKWGMNPTFFKAQELANTPSMRIFKFELLAKDPKNQKNPQDGEIASSLVSCEDNYCEMISFHVNRPHLRSRGYGSLLLQNVLAYLTLNTTAIEIGLLAKPMASVVDRPYAGNFYKLLFHFKEYDQPHTIERERDRLRNFYKKNGGQNPTDEECRDAGKKSLCKDAFMFTLKK